MQRMRRLLPALAVAFVAALVAGTTMAAVSAGSLAANDKDWSIPMGAIGDRGTYRVQTTSTNADGTQDTNNGTLDFGWASDKALDAWGRPVSVDRLDTKLSAPGLPDDLAFRQTDTFLPGDWRIHTTKDYEHQEWNRTGANAVGTTTPRHAEDLVEFTNWIQQASDCKLGSPFAGISFRSGQDIDVGHCQGHEKSLHVTRADGRLVLQAGETYRYVFEPGIPYPIELRERFHADGPDVGFGPTLSYDVDRTWTLTGYTPGSKTRGPFVEPAAPPVFPTVASPAWMIDDAGLDHPFPLSQAYQAAVGDLRYPVFGQFMASHPDAYLVRATYQTSDLEGLLVRQWHLRAADGPELVDVVVNQTHYPNTSRLPAPLAAATGVVDVGADPQPNERAVPTYPPRAQLPRELPSASWVLAQWTTMTQEPADAYGFDVWCGTANCSAPHVGLIAGNTSVSFGDDVPIDTYPSTIGAWESRMHIQWLLMDETGKAEALLRLRSDITAQQAGSSDALPAAAVEGARPVQESLLPIGPGAASGAGAMGILVGLVYYLWPALKSGGLAGLFSRVESSQVSRHPMRRRILDAVAAEPGVHHNGLQRRTGIANGALLHHLGKLTAAGELVGRSDGRYTCYFLPGTPKNDVARGMATRSDGAQAVLGAVSAHPGVTAPQLAETCGIRLSTAQYHTAKLSEAGLVRGIRDGRVVRWHPMAAS